MFVRFVLLVLRLLSTPRTFEDGTLAEVRTPDLGPIVEHKRYVFFLRTSAEKIDAFDLVGGGQGPDFAPEEQHV